MPQKHTHECIHVKGGSGASLFTDIDSTLKHSHVAKQYCAFISTIQEGRTGGRREIYRVGDSYRERVGEE